MRKLFFIIILVIAFRSYTTAQELQARITVTTNQISSQVDKKIFQTLQGALNNFLNNRKWTNDNFQASEKIQCNFLITLTKSLGDNIYQGTLAVQAARPIYNSSYQSPLVNFMDDKVTFRYVEFQPVEFNENRVQGTDASAANLTAILAYYVYTILGFDYDSFSRSGGDPYFEKAWNIVTNAPEGRDIEGWKPFDGIRNRYYLAENLNNNRFKLVHDAIYSYYRSGMDIFYENEDEGRNGILNCLNFLNTLNTENPNSMLVQFFFQGKSNELSKVFSKADPALKGRAKDMLLKLDVSNTAVYKNM
jgi:hypothetical protein